MPKPVAPSIRTGRQTPRTVTTRSKRNEPEMTQAKRWELFLRFRAQRMTVKGLPRLRHA